MTRLDHSSTEVDTGGAPVQARGGAAGDDAAKGQALPADVAIALLETERGVLLGKLRDIDALSVKGQQSARDLEALSEKTSREMSQLEARHQKQVEATRQLGDEAAQLGEQLARLKEAALRHLAVHHRTESRVKLPRTLRWLQLRRPRGWGRLHRLAKDYKLLARSPLFDRQWYLSRNEDVASSGADPLLHYLMHGAAEGRAPGPDFDGRAYLQTNPDVVAAGLNPLVHFLRWGVHEDRHLFASGAPGAVRAPDPIVRGVHAAKRRPQLWFYLGDTVEWLRDHGRVSGVGRVSSELFLASTQLAPQESILPCVLDRGASWLIEVPFAEHYVHLSRKAGRSSAGDLARAMAIGGDAGRSPEPGDHVLFTGLVWTPTFTKLFERLAASGIEFSVLVHDIIPIESPELVGEAGLRSFTEWLAMTVRAASAIYVSNPLVKDKIVRWALLSGLEIGPEIIPIPFGARRIESESSPEVVLRDPQTSSVAVNGFVLSVGTIDRRKNQAFLCRLWRRLIDTLGVDRTPQLVLVGRNDEHLGARGGEFADLVASGKLVVLEGLSDRQLARLYKTCLFTAFPSLSEGYGLPVAESLQLGKLCLASELPEVRQHAGDLCWYFRPGDADAALASFVRAITDPAARMAAEARIQREFQARTWADTLRDMVRAARAPRLEAPGPFPPGPQLPSYPGAESVDPSVALARAGAWCTDVDPEVSILVINWNAASLTLECIRQIWAQTEGHTYEIVVADNGSAPQDVTRLRRLGPGIRLLELGCNRFFGEANNIAAEAARGRFLCLLNNDAFVRPGWLTALVSAVTTDPQVGASGPMFLFPDGRIQEAGARVDPGGYPVRFGRGEKEASPELLQPKFVDYISAAALLVPRDVFMKAGGFDLAYEPAYYEDTDLCLKIQTLGRKILYCPTARVVHNEGSSANGDAAAEARRKALGDLNRDKFVSRWGDYLETRDEGTLAAHHRRLPAPSDTDRASAIASTSPRGTAVVYTPYAITPGGGERFLLTMATALAQRHQVTVVTPHRYSALRLLNIGREFGLDLSRLRSATEKEAFAEAPPDVMVAMCNHVVPNVPGRGGTNIFVCQFPFPMAQPPGIVEEEVLNTYDAVIVYSDYVRSHFDERVRAHKLPALPVEILNPPVPRFEGDAARKKRMILTVGRFFVGGHCKRHDLLITAFKKIAGRFETPVELHLAGSSTPGTEHMDYLASLRASAEGYPIHFHVNASQEKLRELYRDAAVYWHGTGLGVKLAKEPEKAEHFGISPLEAMSAEAVAFALNAGGPRELITSGENGFLYGSLDELAAMTLKLFAEPPARRLEIGRAAGLRARRYSTEAFIERFHEILGKHEGGHAGRDQRG